MQNIVDKQIKYIHSSQSTADKKESLQKLKENVDKFKAASEVEIDANWDCFETHNNQMSFYKCKTCNPYGYNDWEHW